MKAIASSGLGSCEGGRKALIVSSQFHLWHKTHPKRPQMNEYDFTNRNPNEFEMLTNDLISNRYNLHIERFKLGKDLGIAGRF